ncbi:choice-of-anchor Q domain-containing protein [Solilutibacter silvestris]|uniref:Right handed beta helix region n=1 Tax=Solilutibacter silvestris TaxID=1645665 RepID=A0A2K1PZQ0_9GAMM|nr:choice-of-anchor Q domain-containing protein [Lysobacter silvestris]PNS08137.1 hypothetical protein Lysil_2313 [Lysobacter silvestris]
MTTYKTAIPARRHPRIRMLPLPLGIAAALPLAIASPLSFAANTYYVRSDGGDATQCTGLVDAAYDGKSRNCAWSSPNIAFPLGQTTPTTPLIAGGDTLIISPGSYKIGVGAPGTANCSPSWSYDCYPPPIPSGATWDTRTRILGKDWTTCSTKPELWASGRADRVLNLTGSQNVEVQCLDLTDHASCAYAHNHSGTTTPGAVTAACPANPPFGDIGADGIVAVGAGKTFIGNVDVHGFPHNGVSAGKLTDWTLYNVRILGNGWAGWDGDVAYGSQTGSSNSGTIAFIGGEIAWNGCIENYVDHTYFGCWGQLEGGYGDGLGTGRTGGNWIFQGTKVHHNTSDGIDLLYANGTGSVTVRQVLSYANAGNQVKVAGPGLIENSVIIGNCNALLGYPTSALESDDLCRALGNTVSIDLLTGANMVTMRFNTITGLGDCEVISGGGGAGSALVLQNNAISGDLDWRANLQGNTGELTCAYYQDGGAAQVIFQNNLFWNLKSPPCSVGTGNICGKPPLFVDGNYKTFNPTPQQNSPLIDAGLSIPSVTQDYTGNPRVYGAGPDIGAVELQPATTPSPTPAPTPVPPAPTPAPTPAPSPSPSPTPSPAPPPPPPPPPSTSPPPLPITTPNSPAVKLPPPPHPAP